jgi:hypothetical protein
MTTLAKVAPPAETIGLGRKESIYDSDVEGDGTPVGDLVFFKDFQNFASGFNTFTKGSGAGVFTNLSGSGTGSPLPAGYKFGAYRSRLSFHSYDDDPTLLPHIAHFAECRLMRAMSWVEIKTDQATYMSSRGRDLVSWEDNERVAVTGPANGEFIAVSTPGTDHEGRALDVGNQPLVYDTLQSWNVLGHVPVARKGVANFSPTIPIVATKTFDGILIRPTG